VISGSYMFVVDLLLEALRWLLVVFFGGQVLVFIGLVLWTVWTDAIKPRLITAAEFDRVADDIIAGHPDPEEAFARHERARYRSDGAQQTYRYRVRRAVRRRLEQAEACQPNSACKLKSDCQISRNDCRYLIRIQSPHLRVHQGVQLFARQALNVFRGQPRYTG